MKCPDWGLSGSPARPMGPKPPGGGKAPAPRSRIRARWDPEPALGLVIRPVSAWARVRARRSGGGPSNIRGRDCPSRARAWDLRPGGPLRAGTAGAGERTRKKRSRFVTVLPWGFRNSVDQPKQRSSLPQFVDLIAINGAPGEIRTHDLCLRRAEVCRKLRSGGLVPRLAD